MPRQQLRLLLLLAAALALVRSDQELRAPVSLRLEGVTCHQRDVLVVTSHVNTPTSVDPRQEEGDTLARSSRRVEAAARKDDAQLLQHMMRQTPEYAPSLPVVTVAVNEASDISLEVAVTLSLAGAVTDSLSCLREALSHAAASAFCASALPAHAQTISCFPASATAADMKLGAALTRVDCALRQ